MLEFVVKDGEYLPGKGVFDEQSQMGDVIFH